jgi:subtilase family serine protease
MSYIRRLIALAIVGLSLSIFIGSCGDDDDGLVAPETTGLEIHDVSWDPPRPQIGDAVTLRLVVRNSGNTPLQETWARVELDGVVLRDSIPTPGIPVGRSVVATCEIGMLDPGSHVLEACADAGALTMDADPGDNCLAKTLVVGPSGPLPNLQVRGIGFTPAGPTAGDTVVLSAVVINTGAGSAPAGLTQIELDGASPAPRVATPALAANANATITWDLGEVSPGLHQVRVCADAAGSASEEEETDNCATMSLVVQDPSTRPNLLVTQINLVKPDAQRADSFAVVIGIRNSGNGPAPATVTEVVVDGVPRCTALVTPVLAAGRDTSIVCGMNALTAQEHLIDICLDATGIVSESDESDNCRSEVVTNAYSSLDLSVTRITSAPSHPGRGEPIHLSITVRNSGRLPAHISQTRVRVDGRTSGADLPTPQILSGQEVMVECTLDSLSSGSHSIEACADGPGALDESREDNNCATMVLVVQEPGRLPDLVIGRITLDPPISTSRRWVTADVVVRNRGSAPSPATRVTSLIAGSTGQTLDVRPLSPGDSTVVLSGYYVTGTVDVVIEFCADGADAAVESDEGNNCARATLVVSPTQQSNLIIESISFEPFAPTPEDTVLAHVRVRNSGAGRAQETQVQVQVDGMTTCLALPCPSLATGESATLDCAMNGLAIGQHRVRACADAANVEAEYSETDNCNWTMLSILDPAGMPNLKVDRIDLDPPSPREGATVAAVLVIRNAGTQTSGPTQMRVRLDDLDRCVDLQIPEIAVGGDASVSCSLGSPGLGAHTIDGCVDPSDNVFESDESDNCRRQQFSVTSSLPDLIIESISLAPSSINSGDSARVQVTLRNTGAQPAPVTMTMLAVDGITYGGLVETPALDPDQTLSVTRFIGPFPTGSHTLRVCADFTDRAGEGSEGNNCRDYGFYVQQRPRPNLIVSRITLSPASPEQTDTVTVVIQVENPAGGAAGPTLLQVKLDGIVVRDSVATPALPGSGGLCTVRCALVSIPVGSHTLEACADATGLEEEESESDNCRRTTLVVLNPGSRPNLIVDPTTISPAAPQFGDEVTASVHLHNGGTGPTGETVTRVRLFTSGGGYWFPGGPLETPALAAGEDATLTCSLGRVNADFAFLEICLDVTGQVTETSEEDNCRTDDFDIRGPDLVVSSISCAPAQPVQGEPITLTAVISNIGAVAAPSTQTRVDVDNLSSCVAIETPALAPGGNATVTCHIGPRDVGGHTIYVYADATEAAWEVGEANYRDFYLAVSPTPKPDLRVSGISLEPSSPRTGEPVVIRAGLQNDGVRSAPMTKTSIAIDGAMVCAEIATAVIDPGLTAVVSCRVDSLSAGPHEIVVTADATSLVDEVNEGSANSMSATATVRAAFLPDLSVESIAISPSPVEGRPIVFAVILRNQGEVAAPASVTSLRVDGVMRSSTLETPPISAGRSATVSCSLDSLARGYHSVTAYADADFRIAEIAETNNEGSNGFNVNPRPGPNLFVSSVWFAPASPQSGDTVIVSAQIGNGGSDPTVACQARIDLDGITRCPALALPALAAGEYVTVTCNLGVPAPGWHWWEIFVDPDDQVVEQYEGDNWRMDWIGVAAGPGQAMMARPSLPDSVRRRLAALGD